jgi:SAM-dependent methyltransferase
MAAMPEVYTHGHHESVLRSHQWRTAENSAGYLLPRLEPGMSVLDVGCGPGTITVGLADRVPGGHVTGVDSEPGVLKLAREHAAGREDVDFVVGDVYALDYPDCTFSVVYAHQVLQHLGDPVAAVREMARVCRPGGLVALREADFGGLTWYPESPALTAWLDLYWRVARGNGGEPGGGRRVHAWARQAGLTGLTMSSSTWTYATAQERAWWGGLWADRIVASSFAARALDGGYATQDELQAIADGWRAWAADQDGWFAVLNGEVIAAVPADS